MQIIDYDTKAHMTGVDAALEALLAQRAADDDYRATPLSCLRLSPSLSTHTTTSTS